MLLLVLSLLGCASKSIGTDDTAGPPGNDTDTQTDTDTQVDTDTDTVPDTGSVDADGDGYLARVDCDDADANVHPGATETWYDGVDQDCDGQDDDQDGDGYVLADDCDDTDPARHPGAGEVPDDGVDQNCDGVDAAGGGPDADADGDGWASEAYGGPDCDDGNAAINPEAAESVGDDVDSDCDGADYGVSGLVVGDLVISEIMYDPDAVDDGDGEWFEVYNATGHTLNLADLVVGDDAAFGPADIFTVETDLVVAAGARVVFGVSGDTAVNGGIAVDYDFPGGGVSFNNSGDDLYLGVRSGERVTTIDGVAYDELEGWPAAKGYSIELEDTALSASSNDSSGNWCRATGIAGSTTDRGSPGAASSGC